MAAITKMTVAATPCSYGVNQCPGRKKTPTISGINAMRNHVKRIGILKGMRRYKTNWHQCGEVSLM
jgi:hypothetical protein